MGKKVMTIAEIADLPEVHAAVDWWACKLSQHNKHDSGDANLNAGMSFIRSLGTPEPFPTLRQIEVFKECFTVAIAVHCQRFWEADNPNFGAACRTIAVDYGPDHTLQIALAAARIESGSLLLPIKTVMWVGPGSVKVSEGYGASPVNVYPVTAEAIQ